jgi:DNA-binding MarR family transcriptional regulator
MPPTAKKTPARTAKDAKRARAAGDPPPDHNSASPSPHAHGKPDPLDARALEALVGYNARRASLIVSALFAERVGVYGLRQVDYSVLSLLAHNPGATSRQLCTTLDVLPPNLVSLIAAMDGRGLIERRPHPHDGRAMGLHLTPAGEALVREAEQAVLQLELEASGRLTARERETLIKLLQKIYL